MILGQLVLDDMQLENLSLEEKNTLLYWRSFRSGILYIGVQDSKITLISTQLIFKQERIPVAEYSITNEEMDVFNTFKKEKFGQFLVLVESGVPAVSVRDSIVRYNPRLPFDLDYFPL